MPSYNKKEFKESNVNYLNKDFTDLKGSLVNYAKSYFPNSYRDFNETSPGMMLIEMSAYVGDVLSFYVDQQYREMMLPLAEERRNVVNMAKMLGYKVKPTVPAYVNLTFEQDVAIVSGIPNRVDYNAAGIFSTGIKVTSTTDSNVIFETLDMVDFTITGSHDTGEGSTPIIDSTSGLATDYTLSRTVRAISAERKTTSFSITAPTKFLKLTLPDTNVIDIISCVDSNGNKWYEVDYLAHDRVPIETHYTDDTRTDAYHGLNDGDPDTDERTNVATPYSLQYLNTNKRFITEINEDSTTSLVFGNGILKNGTTIDGEFLDLEQAGITIPGQTNNLTSMIDPLLGDEYSTLGETPMQTVLTITYRVGGGISSNVGSGDLTTLGTYTDISGNTTTIKSVTNNIPATGGKSKDSIEEIREKTKAFFSTQNRCVTKEDYEARVLNMSSKFGSIAKVYVSRTAGETTLDTSLQTIIDTLVVGDTITDGDISSLQSVVAETNTPGTVNMFVLSYDNNKNLVGNPHASSAELNKTDNVATILLNNIKNYLNEFRILTDEVIIRDGYIVNFGVIFDVVTHKFANKSEVKLLCIQKIKEYFNIDKMQFGQPIFISQLEYELMGIDGVRAVNFVDITQDTSTKTDNGFVPGLYTYSMDTETPQDNSDVTQPGYGWRYDFSADTGANENGIILPVNPNNPAVFELKNPNQNIKGVVR
jgi:hypothetical protein